MIENLLKEFEKEAMNIVYQIGDILEASVEKRQATNDTAIEFTRTFLLKAFEAGEQAERERLLSALKAGQLCTSCGGENTGALSDTCVDCLENE